MRRRTIEPESLADAYGGMRADYIAAKTSRFRRRRTGVSASGSGADYHYRSESDYLRIMEQARDMDRNDAVIGQLVDRAVGNTVQEGFQLDPQTGDKQLDAELWARWDAWAEDPEQCDVAGELCFYDFESLVPRQMLVDGDTWILPIADGQLQGVEAHRVRTPSGTKKNVVHGVLLDDLRVRRQVWITKDDIEPTAQLKKVSDITPYDVRDADGHRQVFQIYNPKRFSQTRGVSAFAPVFDTAGMGDDLMFAKLVQAQVTSCVAIFEELAVDAIGGDDQAGERTTETLGDGSSRVLEALAPGMRIRGRPGSKLTGFSPAVPNNEFFAHMRLVLTLIGINVGMPLVLVLMDASETNFSGFRGAVDQARLGFRRNQKALIKRFHRPVYLWKLRQWLADDPVLATTAKKLGAAFFAHRWNPPTWPYIEPMKDAGSDLLRLRNGLTSPRRLHAERGRDHEELVEETVQDNALAIRRAKTESVKINAEFADDQPVHWRELLSLPTPDGVSVKLDAGGPEEAETAKPADNSQTPAKEARDA